jgi:hypothetical protein
MLKGRATFFERVRHLHGEYTRNRKQESARRFKLSLLVSWLIIQGGIGAFFSVLSACKTTRERSSREREKETHTRGAHNCFVFAAIFRVAQPEISGQFVFPTMFLPPNILFSVKKNAGTI